MFSRLHRTAGRGEYIGLGDEYPLGAAGLDGAGFHQLGMERRAHLGQHEGRAAAPQRVRVLLDHRHQGAARALHAAQAQDDTGARPECQTSLMRAGLIASIPAMISKAAIAGMAR